ncbi:hypothetical protein GC194_05080 [bacterium]|nr:hypothetical protein [bacterium]
MKNLLLALVATMLLASCSKDHNKSTNKALEGTWNFTSVKMDGQEAYGSVVSNASVTFKMTDDATGTASATATVMPGTDWEQTQTTTSTYVISNDGTTMTETTDSNGVLVHTISIDKKELSDSYIDSDGTKYDIKATKK